MPHHPIVTLIGGTSHAGKSTVARVLAADLGCEVHSSDRLAKHPGRPWPSPSGRPVPPHVAEHYSSLDAPELLADVLRHYERNVAPKVRDIVTLYEAEPEAGCTVIEGSALWPGFVADLVSRPSVQAAWLVPNAPVIQARVYAESRYPEADEDQRHLIDRFLKRTLLYNEQLVLSLEETGLRIVRVDSESPEELVGVLVGTG